MISKSIRKFRENIKSKYFYYIKNISPDDFLNLLNKANLIIGNSSAGIRESSYLGTLSINIGKRQEGRERDLNIIDIPPLKNAIKNAIKNNLSLKFENSLKYGNGEAGKKIVKILENEKFKNFKRFNKLKFN